MTAAIARGLADGLFDDAERLDHFDAVFAGIFGFKLHRARAEAWEAAVLMAGQAPEARRATVWMLDRSAYGVGRLVLAPPFPVPAVLQVVRFAEQVDTSEAIERLDRALGI